jgi:hypothetical protein
VTEVDDKADGEREWIKESVSNKWTRVDLGTSQGGNQMSTYHSYGRRNDSSIVRSIAIVVIGGLILSSILYVANIAGSYTTLTVELNYKGNPYNGIVDVVGVSGQGQGTHYSKNGSSVVFNLSDGVYDVSASYTNSSGTFYTGYWVLDLTHGNILFGHYMTIELSNKTAWWH